MTTPPWLRLPLLLVRTLVRQVLLEPVREGRLDYRSWPAGLLPIAVLAGVAYTVAAGLAILAGPIRSVDVLVNSYETSMLVPEWSSVALLVLVTLGVGLVTTGALHAAWYVKVMVLAAVFTLLLPGTVGTQAWAGWASMIGLVALFVARWRFRFAWWEFPLVTLVLWTGVQLPWLLMTDHRAYGVASAPALVGSQLESLLVLAIPVLVGAGAGLAQIAILAAGSAHATLGHALGRPGLAIGAVLLLGWRFVDVVGGAAAGARWLQWPSLVSAAAALALAAGCGWAVLSLGRAPVPSSATAVAGELGRASLLIGAGLSWPFLVLMPGATLSAVAAAAGWQDAAALTAWVSPLLNSMTAVVVLRAVFGTAMLAVAVVQARRGHEAAALGLAAFGSGTLLDAIAVVGNLDVRIVADPLCILAPVLALGLAGWRAASRRFDGTAAWGLGLLLIVSAVYPHRAEVADPVSALLGFSGLGVLLFGLVWRVLTDGAVANGDSRGFPRPARVLLFLGWALFAMNLVAYVALTRTTGGQYDVSAFTQRGDEFIGTPMLLVAVLIGLSALVRQPRTRG